MSNFISAADIYKVDDKGKGGCPKCGDTQHTSIEHDAIYPDSCMCTTCPLAKQGYHKIPCAAPNTCTRFGYFCPDCLNELGSGSHHHNYIRSVA